jgi:hypothetical protein
VDDLLAAERLDQRDDRPRQAVECPLERDILRANPEDNLRASHPIAWYR